jgi:uncharacterized protein (DUF2126 family)
MKRIIAIPSLIPAVETGTQPPDRGPFRTEPDLLAALLQTWLRSGTSLGAPSSSFGR